jgi:hypothetical protein
MPFNDRELSLAFNFFHTRRTTWCEVYRAISSGIDPMTLDIADRMVLVYRFSRLA